MVGVLMVGAFCSDPNLSSGRIYIIFIGPTFRVGPTVFLALLLQCQKYLFILIYLTICIQLSERIAL